MSAQVLHFPERRTCQLCVHYAPLAFNGYCQLLDRLVREPREVAERCPSFEPGGGFDGEGQ